MHTYNNKISAIFALFSGDDATNVNWYNGNLMQCWIFVNFWCKKRIKSGMIEWMWFFIIIVVVHICSTDICLHEHFAFCYTSTTLYMSMDYADILLKSSIMCVCIYKNLWITPSAFPSFSMITYAFYSHHCEWQKILTSLWQHFFLCCCAVFKINEKSPRQLIIELCNRS